MSLESTATYINSFNPVWPDGADQRSTADDHIRLIKGALQRTFPNITNAISVNDTQINGIQYLGSLSFSILNNGLIDTAKFGYSQTNAESSASVTPTNLYIPSTDAEGNNNILRYGPDLTGVSDSRAAFANASLVGITTKVVPGTYLINSDVTIAPSLVFLTGAILKPAAGVTITLSSQFTAPASQIFDLSLGGSVVITPNIGTVRAEWWGITLNGSADNASSLTKAISLASESASGAQGGAVNLYQTGVYTIGSTITIPNRGRVLGRNKRGNYVKALGTFSGTSMFNAVNGTSSMFDSTLENLTVDANNVAGLGCILSDAWQEDCGPRGLLLVNFVTYGLKIQNGYGGAATLNVRDCEIFGGTTAGAIGIDLQQISSVGGFMLKVQDTTITGSTGKNLSKGINVVKDSLHVTDVHFELCDTAIYLDGVGNTVLIGVNGKSDVTTLVEIASTWTGTLTMLGCYRNAATNFIKDNRASGYGTLAYDDPNFFIDGRATPTPPVALGLPWSAGTFNGTAGTLTTGIGVTSLTKNATGDYTITEARNRPSATTCAPGASCNHDDVNITTNVLGANTFQIKLRSGGVAVDASQVNFWNIRTA